MTGEEFKELQEFRRQMPMLAAIHRLKLFIAQEMDE
jgi:hypothetical protein